MTTEVFNASGVFVPPTGVTAVDVLIVGGGGSGSEASTAQGVGGGGAGGVRWLTALAVTPGIGVNVTVGAGGVTPGTSQVGVSGGSSTFGANTAVGGGAGGATTTPGAAGGSGGGGGGAISSPTAGGAGTAGQGNTGGTGWASATTASRAGGGGGGAGGVGANAAAGAPGAGGVGVDMSSHVGTSVGVAGWFGGGGGGSSLNGTVAAGGQGGGGAGRQSPAGTAGVANTGGGGGASSAGAGSGGSGVVIVVYTIPPPPDPDPPETEGWSVYLEVIHPEGSLINAYRVNDDDLPPGPVSGLPAEGILAEGLVHHRSLPEGVPWPCQPDPERLEFGILAEDASTATLALVKGTSVLCQVFSPRLPAAEEFPFAETPLREFIGRATEVSTEALEEGVLVSATAVDWTSTLAEAVVGDAPWSEETSRQRLDRILDLVNTEYPTIPGGIVYLEGPHSAFAGETSIDVAIRVPITARDVDAQPALGLVSEVLAAWAFDVTAIDGVTIPAEPARYQLSMIYNGGPESWALTPRLAASTLAATEVPADQVELSSKWVQRLASAITTVAVTVKDGTTDKIVRRKVAGAVVDDTYSLAVPIDYNDPGTPGPPVTVYDGVDATTRLANMLRPTVAVTANGWQAEEFTWLLDQATPGDNLPDLGELVVVTGIKAGANPTGTDEVEGLLDADHFSIRDGKPAVSFTLRPRSRA